MRSGVLLVISALMTWLLAVGGLVWLSLDRGFDSLQARLGADVMVVPAQAQGHAELEDIVLNGNPGYFYMDAASAARIRQMPGVAESTDQFFLASAKAACCSIRVQLFGYDPDTDFVLKPWIGKSLDGPLQDGEIVVGSMLNAFAGDKLLFFGKECRVRAKLVPTGTSYDASVFANKNTVKALMKSSVEMKLNDFGTLSPDAVTSCVLLNAAAGTDARALAGDIERAVPGVKAVVTESLISSVAGGLQQVASQVRTGMLALWLLGMVALVVAFRLGQQQRGEEFAVLRICGAPRTQVTQLVTQETLLIAGAGAVMGGVLGLFAALGFSDAVGSALGLPYLAPGVGLSCAVAALAGVVTLVAGLIACRVGGIHEADC